MECWRRRSVKIPRSLLRKGMRGRNSILQMLDILSRIPGTLVGCFLDFNGLPAALPASVHMHHANELFSTSYTNHMIMRSESKYTTIVIHLNFNFTSSEEDEATISRRRL